MFDNVITDAVARTTAKLATLDADALARVEEAATLDMGDWLALGDMASRALLAGDVNADAASTLHAIHSTFHGAATLAERLVFVQVAGELLARRIAR